MATKADIHKARMNGISKRQYVPNDEKPVSTDEVVKLLQEAVESSGPGVPHAAGYLLKKMASGNWRILAARHEGGFGSTGRGADQNRHVTLSVDGKGYHLQIDNNDYVWRITGDETTEQIAPWMSPGTPHQQ
ncbi:hypothetical protein ACFSUS_10930 [Spirosoma soli]|uniref:Uncharacterized protein n=1 Tax=Spirosoma soli TaxID=1770529 RepID=A0ABW5M4B0_9BACT